MTRRVFTGVLAAALALMLLASTAHAKVPRSFFGVVPQSPLTTEDLSRMGEARVGTLRILIQWSTIDPTAAGDDYNWSGIDAIFAGAAVNGVRVLPFLYGTPNWVAALDGHKSCADCSPYGPRSKAAVDAWGQFVRDFLSRYGRNGDFWLENPSLPQLGVRTLQAWNEQNSPTFWAPKPSVGGYVKLLKETNQAVNDVDRSVEVILGGMFGTPLGGRKPALTAWDYLRELYDRKGAKSLFDGVALHPYAAKMKKVKAQIDLSRKEIAAAHDGNTELWFTEIGWASGGQPNPLNRGRQGQATRLRQAFKFFLARRSAWHIPVVTWYSWRDGNHPGACEWCPFSGLFPENSLTPKPSLKAFTEFTGGS
jgi:hypothetical protein